MKKLLIIALLTLPLLACGKEEAKPEPELKPAKKSSEIIEDYIETVAAATNKAMTAAGQVEKQQQTTQDMIDKLEE